MPNYENTACDTCDKEFDEVVIRSEYKDNYCEQCFEDASVEYYELQAERYYDGL